MDLRAYTDQYGDNNVADGNWAAVSMSRERMLGVQTREGLVDRWTRDGRVYITNNPVIGQPETMSAQGTAITLTAP